MFLFYSILKQYNSIILAYKFQLKEMSLSREYIVEKIFIFLSWDQGPRRCNKIKHINKKCKFKLHWDS